MGTVMEKREFDAVKSQDTDIKYRFFDYAQPPFRSYGVPTSFMQLHFLLNYYLAGIGSVFCFMPVLKIWELTR